MPATSEQISAGAGEGNGARLSPPGSRLFSGSGYCPMMLPNPGCAQLQSHTHAVEVSVDVLLPRPIHRVSSSLSPFQDIRGTLSRYGAS